MPSDVTRRGIRILQDLAHGLRVREIADRAGIKPDTVYEQIDNLRRRFGARTNAELVRLAVMKSVIKADD